MGDRLTANLGLQPTPQSGAAEPGR